MSANRFDLKKIILIAVLVVVVILVIKATSLSRGQLTPLEAAVKDGLAPVQQIAVNISKGFKNTFNFAASFGSLQEENESLQQQVRELKSELNRVEEYKLENLELKQMLDYREFNIDDYDLMIASVIGRDPGNWFGTVTVNRGTLDGVQKDMAVVVPEGVVGKVVAVSKHTAEVLLITDPRSGIGAMLQSNRMPGIVEGIANSSGVVRMVYLPKDAPVKQKQVVVTSGMGGIFPKALRIGEVIKAENDSSGLFKIAEVQPFVDFRTLEEVFIVTAIYNPEVNLSVEGAE